MLAPPQNTFDREQYRLIDWVIGTIREHDRLLGLSASLSGNTNLELNGSIDQLNRSVDQLNTTVAEVVSLVKNLPVTVSSSNAVTNISINASWVTKATLTLEVPADKSRVSILATGAAEALDRTTGGVTVAYLRLVVDSSTSRQFSASKDAGATVVNNVMSGTHSRSYAVTPGSTITVSVQCMALNGSAFPANAANFAQVTALATFSN
ncbi:hypothetical protein G7068_16130 [Leucobacter viscericola]|uniref:Uncharacterized protein n=1 Tax=Leucobacter viscericola TaxID=2714935 RepID=A0A6G7XB61_9MICO|nr:hypothetical protein [Leucobacter viscericola]QIK61793.1 hypothetical protein G7068_00140 [Leucobacter viscericola]QIK64575.1 hypothetical protein G7068_16130 [Leucobacter viscericola]